MKAKLCYTALLGAGLAIAASAAQKPRVFITESTAAQVSGDATVGDARGSLAFMGGTSPQSIEVMKAFVRYCPAVTVTATAKRRTIWCGWIMRRLIPPRPSCMETKSPFLMETKTSSTATLPGF
jgi:hypothetical protein